jgi:hypothetical protein
MLQFADALATVHHGVRKSRPPQGRKPEPMGGGRGTFTAGDSRALAVKPNLGAAVDEGAKLILALAELARIKTPNLTLADSITQATNELARQRQWSPELGDAAAGRALRQAREFGGGYAPGFKEGQPVEPAAKRSAYDELVTIAKTLKERDPTLTDATAFVKAREANRGLAARENDERLQVVHGMRPGGTMVDLGRGRFERVV